MLRSNLHHARQNGGSAKRGIYVLLFLRGIFKFRGPSCLQRCTVGPNVKNPPKIWFLKIVKLMDHTYACNSLTYFEYKTHLPETEIDVILLISAWKNSWNHIKWTHFMAGFRRLEPLCGVGQRTCALTDKWWHLLVVREGNPHSHFIRVGK